MDNPPRYPVIQIINSNEKPSNLFIENNKQLILDYSKGEAVKELFI